MTKYLRKNKVIKENNSESVLIMKLFSLSKMISLGELDKFITKSRKEIDGLEIKLKSFSLD